MKIKAQYISGTREQLTAHTVLFAVPREKGYFYPLAKTETWISVDYNPLLHSKRLFQCAFMVIWLQYDE